MRRKALIGARVNNGDAHFGAEFRGAFTGSLDACFGAGDCDMHDLLLLAHRPQSAACGLNNLEDAS